MSFVVHLLVDGLTTAEARRVSHLAAEQGTWPVGYSSARTTRRLRDGFRTKAWKAGLWIPENQGSFCHGLLGDDGELTGGYWEVRAIYRARFAATLRLLGAELPQGYRLTANWVGTEIERDVTLAAVELGALARNSRLRESDMYVVPARPDAATGVDRRPRGIVPATNHEAEILDALPVCEFADPGPLRDRILASVLAGEKTATSSLLGQYVDEELPAPGQRFAVVDSQGRPIAVIEVTEVSIVRLGAVDEEFALAEGEGFRSLHDWRSAHERFWLGDEEIAGLGIAITDHTLVVTERFRLVERIAP